MTRTGTISFILLIGLVAVLTAQDFSGVYTGLVKTETPEGLKEETGTIILKQDDRNFVVTAGPNPEDQYPAKNVERTGETVTFDLGPLGDPVKLLRFEITLKPGTLTGKVTVTSGGENRIGRFEFTRR